MTSPQRATTTPRRNGRRSGDQLTLITGAVHPVNLTLADIDNVTAVLVADGWHTITPRTFTVITSRFACITPDRAVITGPLADLRGLAITDTGTRP